MKDTLENIVIGNFLYGLGLSMGSRPRRATGCINLMQQTPLDRPLGDVMVYYPGTLRLIEFKRERANWMKERVKLAALRMALRDDPSLVEVSRGVHWFIRSQSDRTPAIHMGVRPYLDLEDVSVDEVPMHTFTDSVVEDAFGKPQFSPATLNKYLHVVATFSGVTGLNASGMLVIVDGSGGLRYVAVENFLDLRATAEMLLERSLQVERPIHRSAERAQTLDQTVQVQHLKQEQGRTL